MYVCITYIYNLWQNYALLNDIDSKRIFKGHNLHPRETGFVHAFSHIFTWSIEKQHRVLGMRALVRLIT